MHQKNEDIQGRLGSYSRRLALLVACSGGGCDALPTEPARVQDEPAELVIFADTAGTTKPGPDKPAPSKGDKPLGHALLPCPAHVPEAIDPPAGATLALALPGTGTQNYACTAGKSGEAPAWAPEGPHAVLTAHGDVVVIHFAGPSWQALDGSLLKGAKLASADAPQASAVPWLLLSGSASGSGVLGNVTHIQRLETAGGKAPSSGCDAEHIGAKALVPYKSNYFFYRAAAPGEKVKQCHSAPGKAKSS